MSTIAFAPTRREFLKSLAVSSAGLALAGASSAFAADSRKLRLGYDNFSIRALGLKAPQLLDHAASLKLGALLISDLDSYDSLEEKSLREVRAKAHDLGIDIYAGTWSICPTSKAFRDKWGTAEQHLALGLRVAQALGSPVLRCVLGTGQDRRTPGGIEARIADTVKVCKACRNQAIDAGIKIAIENHAGDLQALELRDLVEAAGKDYVGVTYDAGNATWTMEDPLASLEILGPYTVCSGMRDSVVWEDPEGARVAWTAMGEGLIDWKPIVARFSALCPTAPFILEIISGFSYSIPYLKGDFWSAWPKVRAAEFSQFLSLAKRGKSIPPNRSPDQEAERQYQKDELERSVRFCKEALGLGDR